MNKIELLAPAGSKEALNAAINAGANAVYLGGKLFGARRSAANFSEEELIEAIAYCHKMNVSVYVTVNTLIKEEEFDDAIKFVELLYNNDADAVIIQDLGLLSEVKSRFPDLHCHASTQMTFHDLEGVKFAERMGFSRVVLSRELSFQEIENIVNNTRVEIEFFVHGALCISYSGQCLMSSYIGGRSGNRGACAQPCRRAYKVKNLSTGFQTDEAFFMSPKDLMTYDQIEKLKTLDNVSLKIEGRMKSPDYVYSVVSSYRQGLDEGFDELKVSQFSRTFNRQLGNGFMFESSYEKLMNYEIPSSYGTPAAKVLSVVNGMMTLQLIDQLNKGDELQYRHKGKTVGTRADVIMNNGQRVQAASKGEIVTIPFKYTVPGNALLYKTYDKAFIDEMLRKSEIQKNAYFVKFHFEAKLGQNSALSAIFSDINNTKIVTCSDKIVEKAISRPLDEERVIEQLSKLGGTPIAIESISCDIEDGVSLPVSEINLMRRACIESFLEMQAIRYSHRKNGSEKQTPVKQKNMSFKNSLEQSGSFHLIFRDAKQLLQKLPQRENGDATSKSFDIKLYLNDFKGYNQNFEALLKLEVIPLLPRIIRRDDMIEIKIFLKRFHAANPNGRLKISHIGQLELLQNYTFEVESDYSLNIFNGAAVNQLEELGLRSFVWSTEMSKTELRASNAKLLNHSMINAGVFIYGHLPIMISEYCPVGGALVGHDKCMLCKKNEFALIDDHNVIYPLFCDPDHCRVEVMSDHKINLIDQIKALEEMGIFQYRLAMDCYDFDCNQLLASIFESKTTEEIIKRNSFNRELHSRGSYLNGIE
ncbi:U32 family peptidase [Fusibacter bizertensis]